MKPDGDVEKVQHAERIEPNDHGSVEAAEQQPGDAGSHHAVGNSII